MFQLSREEAQSLRFQIGMAKPEGGRGGRRYIPCAFTEHGAAMLSSARTCGKAGAQVRDGGLASKGLGLFATHDVSGVPREKSLRPSEASRPHEHPPIE